MKSRRTRDATRFEFPQILTRALPPADFCLPHLPLPELIAYLRGDSPALLAHLTSALLELEDVPPFYYKLIQDDLEVLQGFYERSCARNRMLLSRSSPTPRTWLSGAELDDALVLQQMSKS